MELPLLYHKGKTGAVVQWKVWTIGAEVHVEWGQIDGAMQHTFTTSTAKNVGKKNEIKPEDQAEIEAKAMWKHRVERKYSETVTAAMETVFLPMLAHEFEKKKHKVKYPVDVQPKLDGNRALAYWEDDKVVLMSRGGKYWNIPHIQTAIAEILPKGMVLDGEVYKHGLNLQGINKLIKGHRDGPEGTESLKFWAFDYFDPDEEQPWSVRCIALWDLLVKPTPISDIIKYVPQSQADNEQEIKDLCQFLIEEGYEGAIVRARDGKYALGERSSELLKMKNFSDDEFEIVGHYLGEGKHEGCVGWVCKKKTFPEGAEPTFKCYPKGSLKDRKVENPEQYHGKWLKVRYQFITDDGTPFLPIGLAIRLEEDMS